MNDINQGRYTRPIVAPRIANQARKRAIIEGTYGSFVPDVGGWDPVWDKVPKIYPLRPPKGHKRERTREERFQKINDAMKTMPEKIAKYREDVKARKPEQSIYQIFKRVEALPQYKKIMSKMSGGRGAPYQHNTKKKK